MPVLLEPSPQSTSKLNVPEPVPKGRVNVSPGAVVLTVNAKTGIAVKEETPAAAGRVLPLVSATVLARSIVYAPAVAGVN